MPKKSKLIEVYNFSRENTPNVDRDEIYTRDKPAWTNEI